MLGCRAYVNDDGWKWRLEIGVGGTEDPVSM